MGTNKTAAQRGAGQGNSAGSRGTKGVRQDGAGRRTTAGKAAGGKTGASARKPSARAKRSISGSSGKKGGSTQAFPQQGGIWHQYRDEIILMGTLAVSILLLLSNFHLCGPFGTLINGVAFGLFGFLAYAVPFLLFFGVAFALSNRGNRSAVHKMVSTCVLFCILAALLQIVSYGNVKELTFTQLYVLSAEGRDGGGFIGGGIAKLLCMAVDVVGTYIILIALAILLMMFITEKLLFASLGQKYRQQRRARAERRAYQEEYEEEEEDRQPLELRDEGQGWDGVGAGTRQIGSGGLAEEEREPAAGRGWGRKKKRPARSYTFPLQEEGTPESIDMREITLQNLVIHRGDAAGSEEPEASGFPSGAAREEADFRLDMEGMFDGAPDMPEVGEEETPFYEAELQRKFRSSTGGKAEKAGLDGGSEDSPDEAVPFGLEEAGAEQKDAAGRAVLLKIRDGKTDAAADKLDTPPSGYDPAEDEKARILAAKSIEGNKPLDSYAKLPPVAEADYGEEARAYAAEVNGKLLPGDACGYAEDGTGGIPGAQAGGGPAGGISGAQAGGGPAGGIPGAQAGGGPAGGISGAQAGGGPAGGISGAQAGGSPAGGDIGIPAIRPVERPYQFPSVNLLKRPKGKPKGASDQELKETALTLQATLESFGVRVTVTNVSCGPAVTRYELQPERGVKVSRITGLADDIKLNLAAADIRIEAPIPGKAAVGIEVPNKENSTVFLRELVESKGFKEHKSNIAFAVGKDIAGQVVVTDIAKMPHLLIAGATGSGKSVCINTLIMSILYKANPNEVKLIMVDPKVVELSVYNGIPHLLIPVVTDPKKASAALNWAVMEMTDRYQRFAELGVRDIKGYNEKIATVAAYKEDPRYVKMPQIVIIVDELADLMMVAPGEVEDSICRLAQLARAAGLHLIIATQRPSVNVITGLIKANVPSRIAFAVSSSIDSRTILDGAGAEKLLGKGDMLFFPTGYPKPVRVQGAFVSDEEVTAVVEYLAAQNEGAAYSQEIAEKIANAQPAAAAAQADGQANNGQDEYFAEAARFIIEKDKASIGMLQRVYKIGFNRAARIMDQLSEAGVVGPEEGTKPRKILMSAEEFESFLALKG